MRKYITITDISELPCYKNITARLLYLHIACRLDVATYTYTRSVRALALEMATPVGQVRTALKALERDGVIETHLSTHYTTRGMTHRLTQEVTQITLLKFNQLDRTADRTADTPHDTPTDTPPDTPSDTQKNNKIINKTQKAPHTLARARAEALGKLAEGEYKCSPMGAARLVDAFCRRMEAQRKEWESEGDMTAHFLAWADKNRKMHIQAGGDHEARVEEMRRTKEEAAHQDERQQLAEELRRMQGYLQNAIDSNNKLWEQQIRAAMAETQARLRQSSGGGSRTA